jgi:hypothetical protein
VQDQSQSIDFVWLENRPGITPIFPLPPVSNHSNGFQRRCQEKVKRISEMQVLSLKSLAFLEIMFYNDFILINFPLPINNPMNCFELFFSRNKYPRSLGDITPVLWVI